MPVSNSLFIIIVIYGICIQSIKGAPPVWSNCPMDITRNADTDSNNATVTWTEPTVTDDTTVLANIVIQQIYDPTLETPNVFLIGTTEVRYVATDEDTEVASCTFMVDIMDIQLPDIEGCPSNFVNTTTTGTPSRAVEWVSPTATDNDGLTPSETTTHTSGSLFNIGTVGVTITFTDDSGNEALCEFTVTINDEEAPMTSNCPTVDLKIIPGSESDKVVSWDEPTFTDNSGDAPSVTSTHSSDDTFGIGETTVTYTATDGSGNEGYCYINVTVVQDTVPPVFTYCPNDTEVDTLEGQNYTTVNFTEPVATDNIELLSLEQAFTTYDPSGDIYYIGTTTIRYIALDTVDQGTSCVFTITVQDNEMPNITCPSNINVTTDPMSDMANVSWNEATAIDNNDGVLPVYGSTNPPSLFPIGSSEVTYNATDSNNNTAECSFDINVSDEEAPVFTFCPPDLSVGNDPGASNATVTWDAPIATDNSLLSVMLLADNVNGSVFEFGNTTVTYTATDQYDNVNSNCSFVITVSDTEPPMTDDCFDNMTMNTDNGESYATGITWTVPVFTDNSGSVPTVTESHDSSDTNFQYPIGTTEVTYNATDDADNLGQCVVSIIIIDDEEPDFTDCPGDITDTTDLGSADAVITWGAVEAIDNSGVEPTIDSNYENGTSFPIGSTLVMYNATDMYGNTNDSCSFTVNITDNEAPVFTSCPDDITSETDPGSSTSVKTWNNVTATDNSNEQPTILSNYDSGFAFPIGVTIVEYNATDAAGNVNETCSFNITIMDMEPPEFTSCPSDITNETDPGLPTAVVTWPSVTAVDNSLLTVIIDGSHESGDTFPIGTTDVMFNATDPAGNVNTTCEFSVTIEDTEPPVFTECPSDIMIGTDPDLPSAVVNWTTVEATDNSGDPPTILSNFDGGGTFPIGSTLVKYNATDMAENVNTTCQFFVNVTDDEAPVFTFCPSDNTSTTDPGVNSTTMEWMSAEATDNSNETPMYMRSHDSGDTFEFGDTTVQINASDVAGNVNYTCVFVITITDDEMPMTDDCPIDLNVTTDSGDNVATGVTWTSPTFTDNVDSTMDLNISESQPSDAATEFSIGATMITINATDLSMNTGMCTFNIYVTDEEAPVFTMCPDDQSVNTTEGEPTGMATWMEPTATDNSGELPDIVGSHNQATFEFPAGETVVEYTATDPYDNVNTTCTFTITVEDNEAPIITLCPSDVVDYTDTTTDSTSVMWSPTTTATDNSGVDPNITTSIQQGATLSIGNHTVYVNATDGSGNVNTTCSFNIEIIDNVMPDLTCPNDTLIMLGNESSTAFVNWTEAEVSDNSGLDVSLSSSPKMSGDEFDIGTFVITYTAIDFYGNEATCTFTVTVRDLESPYFENCTESFTVGTDPGLSTAVVSWVEPVAMDNNGVNRTVQNYYPNQIYNISTYTVVYVAYDDSNNNATCEFVITVEDQENPNITCPDNITAQTVAGTSGGFQDWTVPIPTDNVELLPTSPVANPDFTPPINIPVTGSVPYEQTYTAEDTAGNTASCTFYIIIEDKEPPVINDCPSDQNLTTSSGVNYTDAIWTEPTADDNTVVGSLVSTHSSGSDFYIGETLVTYTAEDIYENTATCNFTVNVTDDEPPTFNCPASFNVNTSMNANSTNVTWQYPTFMDNSYEMVTVTESHTIPTVFEIGVHEVTYSFEDIYSNEDSCSFNITINDFEDPEVIFCPDDIHNNTEPGLPYANITWSPPVAEDNSGFFTTVQTATSGDGFGIGFETVTFTFTDANMNMNECVFIVNITDIENPVINCPEDLTVGADAGQLDTSVTWSSPTTSDNSNGDVDLAVDYMNGSTFSIGTTVVSYQATDPSGNMENCTFNITVEDTEAPIVSDCPEDFTLPTDDGEPDRVTYWTEPTATDNSGMVFVSRSHTNGSTFDLDNTTVTYNFTDSSENLASCEFIVTIIDIEAPVPTSCPSNSTFSTDMGVSTRENVAWTPPAFNDNVPGLFPDSGNNIFPNTYTFQLGTTEVEYYATDAAMNTGYCTFFITVIDTEDPVVTCPSNITANSTEGAATAIVNYTATATDNVNVTSQSFDIPSGSMFNFGDTAVTFTASDAAGNEANCTFFVTIEDLEPPEFTNCPGELNGTTDATVNYTTITWDMLVATDNSLVTPTIASSHNPDDEFYIGSVTVTATATDGAGNEATCTFDVLVIDDEVPSIMNCPADMTQMADMGTNTSNVNWTEPTATDNSYEEPIMMSSHSPNDVFEFGMTTVEYNFTDGSGNLAQCIFTVTISDDEPPEFQNCPTDIEDTTDFDENTSEQSWTAPTATDNNGVPDVNASHTSPFMFVIGVTNVTYLATDNSGNTAECYFLVNITDQQNPNVTCPTITSMDTATGDNTVSVMWSPTSSDNDGVADVTSSPSSGTAFEIGDTNVTVTVTDNSGNIEMCTFTVTITDPEYPVISNCPDNRTQTTDLNQNYTSVTWTEPTATDNDGTPTQANNFSPEDDFEIGEHTVVYTFTDPSGNEATCTFYINITDDEPPVTMDCPADITNTTDDMDDMANSITWTPPTYTDNSNQPVTVVISGSTDPPASFPIGITNVTYTATDESGNVDVCTFQVEITDDEPPVIDTPCPDDITNTTDHYGSMPRVLWTPPTATDNSGTVVTTSTNMPNDTFPVGYGISTTVTYTFTDPSDNFIDCSFVVTIEDNIPPELENLPVDFSVNTSLGENYTNPTWTPPTATDNSDVAFVASTIQPGEQQEIGEQEVCYVAIDLSNNAVRECFTITVEDNEDPVISNYEMSAVIAFADPASSVVVDWLIPEADDNSNQPVTVICNLESGTALEIGNYTVTCNSTDPYNNTAYISFEVFVFPTDTEPPVLTCPDSFDISTDMGVATVSPVTWDPIIVTDNYGVHNLSGSLVNGSSLNLGETLVTYIAFDVSGLQGECNFTITVIDDEDPVITNCPSDEMENTDSGKNYSTISISMPTYTDNSGSATISKSPDTDEFDIGSTMVIFTVTDNAGNSVQCQLTVTVQDMEPPTITYCPGDIQEDNIAGTDYANVTWTSPTATDNDAIVNTYMSAEPIYQFTVGETLVNATWVDASGNVATCTFDVDVRDVEAPEYTNCPTTQIQQETPIGSNVSAVNWTSPSVTDNVAVVVDTNDYDPGDVFELGVTTVTYHAEDAAGNIKECVFTVLVIDTEDPEFSTCATLQPSITNTTLPGNASGVMYWDIPMATDNDGVNVVTASHEPGDLFPFGSTTVLYEATDNSGNKGTCSFQVQITDNEDPVLVNCPNDTTASPAMGSNSVTVPWDEPQATDNVATNLVIISSDSPNTNFSIGNHFVTYTVSDQSGNHDTCSFVITVEDTTPPEFSNCPANITQATVPGENYAIVDWPEPTATDNTATLFISNTFSPMDSFPYFYGSQLEVRYQVTDLSGNSDTCIFYVTVTDEEAPVFDSCLANQTVDASETAPSAVVIWETPDVTDNVMLLPVSTLPVSGTTFAIGSTEVVVTASDFAGNSATCKFYVNVNDNTPPYYDPCPGPIAFNTDLGMSTATATWTNLVVVDNVGVDVTYSSHNTGVKLPPGVHTVYNNASDVAGNSVECSFDITVTDNEDPVFVTCPETFKVIASASMTMTPVAWTISPATDNVGVVSTTNTHTSGDSFEVGTYVISYSATDAANNTKTCEFTLVVQDSSAPTFENCSSSMNLDTDENMDGTNVDWATPIAYDNSGNVVSTSMTPEIVSGSYLTFGIYNINYTAVDAAGNIGYCLFTIYVNDNEDPQLDNCPTDVTTLPDSGTTNAVINFERPNATDNSGYVSESGSHQPDAVFPAGTTTVTYTFTDQTGNAVSCVFSVTVEDNEAPEITNCPASITNNTDPGEPDKQISWVEPTITDNAGEPLLERSHIPDTVFTIGSTTVNYTATDSFGNKQICSFIVTIIDDESPVISDCPTNQQATTDADEQTAVVAWTLATATDNSGQPGLTSTYPSGYAFPIGETVVTYVATDSSANQVQCTFTIYVTDNQPPEVMNCPNSYELNTDPGLPTVQVTWVEPTFIDNVDGEIEPTRTYQPGSNISVGSFPNTYQATDSEGNVADCVFTITVKDEEPPVFPDGCPDNQVITDTNLAFWQPPLAIDNTILVTLTSDYNSGTAFATGITSVMYMAFDQYGNEQDCVFSIEISGSGAPLVETCPESFTVEGETTVNAVFANPTATDNGQAVVPVCNVQPGDELAVPSETQVICVFTSSTTDFESNCIFVITAQAFPDTTDPVISNCPENIEMDAPVGSVSVQVTWTPPTASDDTDDNPDLEATISPGSLFSIGQTTVQYIATDAARNIAYCTFTVDVTGIVDTTDPEITCPSAVTEYVTTGTTQFSVSWTEPTPTDDSGSAVLSSNFSPNDLFTVGEVTIVTYTATDSSSNSASCSFTVTVTVDDEEPQVEYCPDDITETILSSSGSSTTVTWTIPIYSDNSGADISINSNVSPDDVFNSGTTTVVYSASDNFGNTNTECRFEVEIVVDDPPEVFGCSSNLVHDTDSGEATAMVTWSEPVFQDAIDGTLTAASMTGLSSGSDFPIGVTDIVYTAADTALNSVTCEFTVTVNDNEIPVFDSTPSNPVTAGVFGATSTVVEWPEPTVSDNSNVAPTLTLEGGTNGGSFNIGTTSLIYTATDGSGNQATFEFDVMVIETEDTEAPTFDFCPSTVQGNNDAGSNLGTVSWEAPTASDNLATEVTITPDMTSGSFEIGVSMVTFTATDGVNMATCVLTVTIIDNEDPVLSNECPSAQTVYVLNDQSQALITWNTPTFTDNSGEDVTVTEPNVLSGEQYSVGELDVTYTAMDAAGNSLSCSFVITIEVAADTTENTGTVSMVSVGGIEASSANVNVETLLQDIDDLFRGSTIAGSFVGIEQVTYNNGVLDFTLHTTTDSSLTASAIEDAFYALLNGASFDTMNTITEDTFFIGDGECTTNPCQNGGTCTRTRTSYTCACVTGYEGTNCETDTDECSDSSICTGGAVCSNLVGSYSCDCPYGSAKIGGSDTCTAQVTFNGAFTLEEYDGDIATFTSDLNDPTSDAYIYLRDKIIEALAPFFSDIDSYVTIQIVNFASGSIIVEYGVLFEIDSSANADMLDTMFSNNVNGSGHIAGSSLVLDLNSIQTFAEVCPTDYCKNGGTCETSSVTFESECSCTDGWSGTTCEDKSGLETWEIAAIASGAGFLVLLLVIIAGVCCCCFLGVGPQHMYDEEFHIRDSYRHPPNKDRLYDNYYNNENFHPERGFNDIENDTIYDNRGGRFYHDGIPETHFSRPFIASGDELSDPRYSPRM